MEPPLHDPDDVDAPMRARVTVVIATRNRCAALTHTLARLAELRPAPPVIVVDNGSDDDSVRVVGERFPAVRVLAMGHNLGAAARNLGVQAAATPYVAFCDDDSWWAPGSLERAAAVLDGHRRVALVAARTLVGPQERTDPVTTQMAASPLPTAPGAPGPSVLGFLACAAVLRRDAFLQVGGFSPLLFVFGEETLLAYDLAAAGWQLCYVADVVAHHHPSPSRADPRRRDATQWRNALLTDWMRRPVPVAVRSAGAVVGASVRDPAARAALAGLLARLPAALAQRAPLPALLEQQVELLEATAPADA